MSDVPRRQPPPWQPQEIAALITMLGNGASQHDVAAALGRTEGAVAAVAFRLLEPSTRPSKGRNRAWALLRNEINTATTNPDWWSRYRNSRRHSPHQATDDRRFSLLPTGGDSATTPTDLGPLVLEAVNELTRDDDRQLLLRRLGVSSRPATLQDIANDRGISRQRIGQLEKRALDRICTRAQRPDSAAYALAEAIDYLADADAALIPELIILARTWFPTSAVWLAKTVFRMAGREPDEIRLIADLTQQQLSIHRADARDYRCEQLRRERADQHVRKWIADAAWPTDCDAIRAPEGQRRHRTPEHGGKFRSHKLSRIVYFESGLEETVLQTAELSSLIRHYQEQPCRITYAGVDGTSTYYPDLHVSLADHRQLLIEIKPLGVMATIENQIKSAAGQRFAAEHGWGWVSVGDRGQTFQDLRRHQLPPRVFAAISAALQQGPLRWPQIKDLRRQNSFTAIDVAAYAIQTNTPLSAMPYQLGS
ncbi:sigma factor-like helix-turn-helix DNA-binding protein (plasmid) [Mycobacterium sp. C3-094]